MKMIVEIREHEGCFYATCEQMPGFLLASKNMKSLDADILPAMKMLIDVKQEFKMRTAAKKTVKKVTASSKPTPVKQVVMHRELAFA